VNNQVKLPMSGDLTAVMFCVSRRGTHQTLVTSLYGRLSKETSNRCQHQRSN
jgi:hypothetical protein